MVHSRLIKLCFNTSDRKETVTVNAFTRLFYFAIDRTLLIIDFTIKRTPSSYRPYTCQLK